MNFQANFLTKLQRINEEICILFFSWELNKHVKINYKSTASGSARVAKDSKPSDAHES